jgi:hypothetical protein
VLQNTRGILRAVIVQIFSLLADERIAQGVISISAEAYMRFGTKVMAALIVVWLAFAAAGFGAFYALSFSTN